MHSIRNVITSLLTCSATFGQVVSLPLAGRIIDHIIGLRGGRISIRSVRSMIYGCCGLRLTTVRAGSHGQRVIRTHRIAVCLTGGCASDSFSRVKGVIKGHSRTAILRTYGAMESRVRAGGSFHSSMRRVRTLLGT